MQEKLTNGTTMTLTSVPDEKHGTVADRGYATIDPSTGEQRCSFPFLETRQIDERIRTAAKSYRSWRNRPVAERAAIVRRAGDLMLQREDALSTLVTLEMGKLIGDSHWEVRLAAQILRYYGEKGPRFLQTETLSVDVGAAEIVNEPVGVVLGIEPWNFPLYQVVRFAGPNLVVGNTILLKHAKSCPQTAMAIEELFVDAGAGEGVYTNVFLSVSDVEQVIAHPSVQGVSLTGSDGAGRSVAELAGRSLKKCVLELGGSDPFIVLDAPDMSGTVDAAVIGRLANTGQSCVAAKRFLVVDGLFEEFVGRFAERLAALSPGDPSDPSTELGPLSSDEAASNLVSQVRDAVDRGATVRTGGHRMPRRGAYVEPTLLTGVQPGMRAFDEELFGPVAVAYRVADDDEAVSLANATQFGLGGAIFCSDLERARAVADRLESGMVWINHPTSTAPELPFGGVKGSGFGRELSRLGMFEFTNRKLIRTM